MQRGLWLASLLLTLPLVAWAQQSKTVALPPDDAYADLRPGPGLEATQAACRTCHSSDYIVMQPRGDAKQWEGVVAKMIKVYGAPIGDAEFQTIVRYLSSAYGR
jgi:sulfite dehydrogenase (cytochrome) subunit B